VERVDLSDVWQAPRPAAFRDIRRWLLSALVIAVLLEALESQVGWTWRRRSRTGADVVSERNA
jgi:hypothetical protein